MKKALLIPILLIPLLVLNLIHLPHNRHNGVQIGEILENSTIFKAKIDYNMYSECPGFDPIDDALGFTRYFITDAYVKSTSGVSWYTITRLDDNNRGFVIAFTVSSAGEQTIKAVVEFVTSGTTYTRNAFFVTANLETGVTYRWKVICPKLNLTYDWGWIYITPCNPTSTQKNTPQLSFKLNGEAVSISPTASYSYQKLNDYNVVINYTITFSNVNDIGKQFDEVTVSYAAHFFTIKFYTPLVITDVGDSIVLTINVKLNSVINT
jgi:hypothetical protein